MDMHEFALQAIVSHLRDESLAPRERLHRILRTAARHRGELLSNTLLTGGGNAVRTGPFTGLVLPTRPADGSFAPKLLGCYEAELHHCIERTVERARGHVVNIGCAEGYYAVGLARLMPNSKIFAYDIDNKAQNSCRETAIANDVSDRVKIRELFTRADFEQFPAGDTMIICDIEGAELELLVPEHAPALAGFDIQVELHNSFEVEFNQRFIAAFKATHDIEYINAGSRDIEMFEEIRNFEHLDQLLSFWEHRRGPNPWLFMTPKNPHS
jgi:hypothetical protein